jgi:hypothetical protein
VPIIAPSDLRPQNRRRSKRIQLRVAIVVRLRDTGNLSTSEKTEAIIVNNHGALILLATAVKPNQIIRVENVNSREELLCRVTSLGETFMGKTQVGVEFVVPTPGFWPAPPKPKKAEAVPASTETKPAAAGPTSAKPKKVESADALKK